jgi:hypothetical protein
MKLSRKLSIVLALMVSATAGEAQTPPQLLEPGWSVRKLVEGPTRLHPAVGPGGAWGFDVYACSPDTQVIERISADGTRTPFADLSALIPSGVGAGPWWPSFDRVGNFGFDLFVDEDSGGPTDGIFRVTPAGVPSHFTESLGDDADALGFDTTGAFGGALLLIEGAGSESLTKYSGAGVAQAFAVQVPDFVGNLVSAPPGPFGGGLLIAGRGTQKVFEIPPGHAAGAAAGVLIDFAANGSGVFPLDIAFAPAGGAFDAGVLHVVDSASASLLKVDATGSVVGTFATGIPPGTLQFGLGGAFADTLLLSDVSAGTLWLIEQNPATAYCTAGSSASGCKASLSAGGTPSATAVSGFDLLATDVEGQKDGLYFFGTNGRQANPWGNGTSFQCVVPPVKRGGLLVGSGTNGLCDGSFSQDLNARWTAKPVQNPGAGAVVQAQLWYRDPFSTSNQTTSLSNAIEFLVAP